MTVRELIELLSTMPLDMEVGMEDSTQEHYPVVGVRINTDEWEYVLIEQGDR